jgi:hypothetical protein
MATATKKSRAARQLAPRAARTRAPAEFLIFEDQGCDHQWTIVAGDGTTLDRVCPWCGHGVPGKGSQ